MLLHSRRIFTTRKTLSRSISFFFSSPSPVPIVGDDGFVYVKQGENPHTKSYNDFYKRKVLPPKLFSENVVKTTFHSTVNDGVCDVYLVGTEHESKKSCQEVQAVIDFLKPQVVFLELCSIRVGALAKSKSPPSEFLTAYEEALKYGGKVILGDQPVDITLQRVWRKMRPKEETLFQQLRRVLLKLKGLDKEGILSYVKDIVTSCMEPLLDERDQYMSALLLKIASKHNSVVAVVGKGHLLGMLKLLEEHTNQECRSTGKSQLIDVRQLL